MNCRRFEKWFALDVEGDLPVRKRLAVAEHLAGCEQCRNFAARMEVSQRAVRDLANEPVEEAVLDLIRARVLARVAEEERPRRSWRFAYAAIPAVMAVVAVVVWMSRPVPQEPPPVPRPVASMPTPPVRLVPKPLVRRAVRRRPAPPKPRPEPLMVKLETSDPNVVIYWIVESGE